MSALATLVLVSRRETFHDMKALWTLFALLSIPLMLMNVFGGIVSGIWLAFLGEWRLIFIGLLVAVSGTLPISIALLPSILFALPAAKLVERGYMALAVVLTVPSALYTVAVMSGWCYLVFSAAFTFAAERHAVPILLWSYGVATGPWTYMASKEDRGAEEPGVSTLYAFFISLAYLLMIFIRLFGGADFATCFTGLIVVMGVALLCQFIFMVSSFSAARHPYASNG